LSTRSPKSGVAIIAEKEQAVEEPGRAASSAFSENLRKCVSMKNLMANVRNGKIAE